VNPDTSTSRWRLLRRGPFARYMAGELVSMLGTWMQLLAQGWVVTALTSSALTLGLVNFASGLPMLALTMFGGVVADRHDKRRICSPRNRPDHSRDRRRLAGRARTNCHLAYSRRRNSARHQHGV
jgi:hypothetical protein